MTTGIGVAVFAVRFTTLASTGGGLTGCATPRFSGSWASSSGSAAFTGGVCGLIRSSSTFGLLSALFDVDASDLKFVREEPAV